VADKILPRNLFIKTRKDFPYFLDQFITVFHRMGKRNHHPASPGPELFVVPQKFSDHSFQPVSPDGVAGLAGDGDAEFG
jgi:hypothetical protein